MKVFDKTARRQDDKTADRTTGRHIVLPSCRLAVLSLIALCAMECPAQERMSVREAVNPLHLLSSPDGAFCVGTSEEMLRPHRFTVLNLCRVLHQRLIGATGVRANEGGVIMVVLGGEKRNEEGISIARRGNDIAYYVEVADPETVDAALLAGVLARCVLNNWLLTEQRRLGVAEREEVPLWFARGVVSFLEGSEREARFEAAEGLMMAGRLKPVAELLEDGGGNPEVSAVLVAWLMETGGRNGYLRLQEALAKGAVWSGQVVREALLGLTPAQSQESWDLWLHRCRQKVFNPGEVSEGVWARLRQMLYVYPVDTARLTGEIQRGRTFAEFIEMGSLAWRKRVAEERMVALRASAAGRSKAYQEVVEAYCDFLTAVVKNEKVERLNARLSIAEAKFLAAYAAAMNLNKEQE